MSLSKYNQKRNFNDTPEPAGKSRKADSKLIFVVQRHHASHLHYDLRISGELTNPAISPTQLIDPQTLIATAQLPEVTVTAKGPNKNQQLPVQEIQIPEIKNPDEKK